MMCTLVEDIYNKILKCVEELINEDPDKNSEEGVLLNVLADAIVEYEKWKYPEFNHVSKDEDLSEINRYNFKINEMNKKIADLESHNNVVDLCNDGLQKDLYNYRNRIIRLEVELDTEREVSEWLVKYFYKSERYHGCPHNSNNGLFSFDDCTECLRTSEWSKNDEKVMKCWFKYAEQKVKGNKENEPKV